MKHVSLLTVVIAAVTGFASAWIVADLRASEAPRRAPESAQSSGAATPAETERLVRALEALQLEGQALRARIEALEQRPEPAARLALEPAAAPTTSAPGATDPAAAVPLALLSTELPETVRATLEEIRAEERAAEQVEREAREAARREERLARLQEQLGLSNGQVSDLRTWMIEARTAREELERQREQGGDREALRTARAELRTRDEASLQRILTPAQFQAWQERESRDDEREARGERQGRADRGQG